MKNVILTILIFCYCCWNTSAQNFYLKINGATEKETKTIDSLTYATKHQTNKKLQEEVSSFCQKLAKNGFIDYNIKPIKQITDSTFSCTIDVGLQLKEIYIRTNKEEPLKTILETNAINDIIKLNYKDIDIFLNETLNKLEQKGYALAKLQLTNIKRANPTTLYADLIFEPDHLRQINSIEVLYTDKINFPKSHLKQILNKYQKKTYNLNTLNDIYKDFANINFINQPKYPEVLLTKATTKVYVYLEKKNANTFDGFLGFTNNEKKKLSINGYLDLKLENLLSAGEKIAVYWKSDGNDQKTFQANLEIPYLFQTKIGIKTQLQIFRQDSTFQNTKNTFNLSYISNYNTRFYLGYESTESSDIQNANNSSIADFTNQFITATFDKILNNTQNAISSKQNKVSISVGFGNREINNNLDRKKNGQIIASLQSTHEININKKQLLYLNNTNQYIKSNNYIANELYRFGGYKTLRGFQENNFEAYYTSTLMTEYRYTIAPRLYIHSILDGALFRNLAKINNENNMKTALGVGIGLGLQTNNGLLKIALANGTTQNQKQNIYNTLVHFSYNVKF